MELLRVISVVIAVTCFWSLLAMITLHLMPKHTLFILFLAVVGAGTSAYLIGLGV